MLLSFRAITMFRLSFCSATRLLSTSLLIFSFLFPLPLHAETLSPMRVCKIADQGASYACSIGAGGIRADKKEGDGATPVGEFFIRKIFYRADKLSADEIATLQKIKTHGFSVQALTPDDIWVDDVRSVFYNQGIKASDLKDKTISHEKLWREDDVYDIIAVVGYNDAPIVKGRGSAIFMHIARVLPSGNYGPTAGCIAFTKPDLLKVLLAIRPETQVRISEARDLMFF
jgi:L,D-peptidoglycan transpeptidase YkuD (ErfK/YbiS/YcfS/YnhG family)